MIMVAYDGSADAQAAIARAGQLMPGAETTVLSVWQPLAGTHMRTGPMGKDGGWADVTALDAASP